MKITKTKVRRKISLDDFMRLKKDGGVFENTRYNAKSVNFSFLFGATAGTFAKTKLALNWTEQDADTYIEQNNLYELKDKIISRHMRESPVMWKYITCATDIRNKFFQTYPGLMERITRERAFALDRGYIRCWHGPVRRIPELFLMSKNDKGKPNGDDQKIYGKMLGTMLNQAANTSIQNFEAVLVMGAIAKVGDELEKRNLKTKMFNSVHDSIDLYLHKSEVQEVHDILVKACETPTELTYEMPQEIDMDITDLQDSKMYYKKGKDWKNFI